MAPLWDSSEHQFPIPFRAAAPTQIVFKCPLAHYNYTINKYNLPSQSLSLNHKAKRYLIEGDTNPNLLTGPLGIIGKGLC